MPRLEDYLAGGRWAKLSYYQELSNTAERILIAGQAYVAFRCHLQIARPPLQLAVKRHRTSPLKKAEDRARKAVERADALGTECGFSSPKSRAETRAISAYRAAFQACAELLDIGGEAFQRRWFKKFWRRNYEALMVLSVVRNAQEGIDSVPRWLETRTGKKLPTSEQGLLETVVEALYYYRKDRAKLLRDPLARLLLDPPEAEYDFTVISAMGVITEGAGGRELEAAYERLFQRRGIRTIRADTATARSLDYNAARIEEAVRQASTPWGTLGYSQGCANILQAESRLLGGTPEQQALARGLRCRNLLFSAANGSAHGTCGDLKLLRAIVEGEQILKHYQALLSKPAIEMALHGLRLALDSKTFVHSQLGSDSLSHTGVQFLQREGLFKSTVPTSTIRGIVEPGTLPEALEWLSNVLTRQIETSHHDTQVAARESIGFPANVRNQQADLLRRCDMGSAVQRTHHWSPLLHETELLVTERDRKLAIYDTPKDRHVFPWIDVNVRFGIIRPR